MNRVFDVVTAVALACFVSAASASCHDPARSPRDAPTARAGDRGEIVIGAAWPWKLRQSMLYLQGLELAIEHVNGGGGVDGRQIRVVKEDDEEAVEQGQIVAQRFARDPAMIGVIGHLQSYVCEPAAAIYDMAGLVMIAPAATAASLTTHGYKRVFRTIFTDDQVGQEMAEYAIERGYRRSAIYYMRNVYGREIANAFEERGTEGGLTVIDRQSYDPNAPPPLRLLTSILEEWKNRRLDSIFIAGEGRPAAALVTEARRLGIAVPVLGSDAMGTPDLFMSGDAAVEGAIVPTPFHPDQPRPEVRVFVAAFERRYGRPPDAAAAQAYDAVQVLAHAITTAGSSRPELVARALHELRGWPGVTGDFTFTPDGSLAGRRVLKMVARHGRFEYLSADRSADHASSLEPRLFPTAPHRAR